MADVLKALSPLHGLAKAGRYGRAGGAPGLAVTEITNCAVAHVLPAPGAEAFQGLPLPGPGKSAILSGARFIWSGPGQWLALKDGAAPGAFAAELGKALPGAGIVDQSDAFALLTLSGPGARNTLAKGPAFDLHPRAFQPGDAALTHLHHIRLTLWQIDDAPSYGLAVPRSYAASFWHWLEVSAGEFGREAG